MVLEVATLTVDPAKSAAYEQAFAQAQPILSSMQGYISHRLERSLETPGKYVLLVEWNRLEDHTIGFRQSPQFPEWKRLLHHFYDPAPTIEHFEKLLEGNAE